MNRPKKGRDLVCCYLEATNHLSERIETEMISDDLFRELGRSLNDRASEPESDNSNPDENASESQFLDLSKNGPEGDSPFDSTEYLPNAPTFSTCGQSRTGSRHGRGGRRAGSGFRVRQLYKSFSRIVLCKRMYVLCSTNRPRATKLVIDELKSTSSFDSARIVGDSEKMVHNIHEKLLSTLEGFSKNDHPFTIQHLPISVLGVSAHFTKSDAFLIGAKHTGKSRERHAVNTWLDKDGGLRCTCIGSTQYFILARNNEFQVPCCEHTEAFADVFNEVGTEVFGIPEMNRSVIYSCFSKLQPDLMASLKTQLPLYLDVHRELGVALVCDDVDGTENPSWVPIRRVQRKGIKYLCAFCDLVNTNSCHHIRKLRDLMMANHDGKHPLFDDEPGDRSRGNRKDDTKMSKSWRKYPPISFLPLGPVNCPFSLKMDQEICEVMKKNGTFVITAPSNCIYCGFPRSENTRDINKSGTIICTIGACRVEIHTYKCRNCNRRFSAEGREEAIFVDSTCAAATHAMLREQLTGFALGNGSLSSRLSQLHSKLSSLEDSKVFRDPVGCKSAKTLYSMCIGFVHLMVMDPPKSLFWCPTCQESDPKTGKVSIPRTICVDGIWAGYLKKSSRAFRNVSAPCKSQNPTRSKNRKRTGRPQIILLRLEKTVSILLQAIKGEKIDFINAHLNAVVAAFRIVNENVLPPEFHSSSVCGTLATDFEEDIGEGRLKKIRHLTGILFDTTTLLYRLMKPLRDHFEKQCKRRRKKNQKLVPDSLQEMFSVPLIGTENAKDSQGKPVSFAGRKRKRSDEYWKIPEFSADFISRVLQNTPLDRNEEDGVPWNPSISKISERDDLGNQMLKLYKSFLQGPLPHLVRRREVDSASLLAEYCIRNGPDSFLKEMVKKDCFSTREDNESSICLSNIAETSRVITGGLISAAFIDKDLGLSGQSGKGLLWSFGTVLKEVSCVVMRFYKFYENDRNVGLSSAAAYAREWSSTESQLLRSKFLALSKSKEYQDGIGCDYDDKYTTGTFFPSFPQLRPLPFNDEGRKGGQEDAYGFCSKHYLQNNGSFTPGAITFCCACKHPITIGYKVLEWDEGPRAILDVLTSRFATFPNFVIYDFACGVYKSAVHPLWWSVQDSTLVSDPFHGCNHKCSPAFLPSAHVELDMRNTIAHEQRNRPIAHIKGSLQQTSQEVYIALLSFQIMINNIQAKIRTASHTQDPVQNRSEKDIEWGYFKRLKMRCPCCQARGITHLLSVTPTFTEAQEQNRN